MPSLHRGVDIVDGIPVYLKSGIIYAFQPEIPGSPKDGMRLGTYNPETKVASWEHADASNTWLETFRASQVTRLRK
jgi:hypothetical protein